MEKINVILESRKKNTYHINKVMIGASKMNLNENAAKSNKNKNLLTKDKESVRMNFVNIKIKKKTSMRKTDIRNIQHKTSVNIGS